MGLSTSVTLINKPPRDSGYQLMHFIRAEINFNTPNIANGVPIGALPANALIIGTDVHVQTAFNAVTTNVLTVGTNSSSYDNIAAAGDVAEGSTGLTQDIKPTGTALGPITADAVVYAKYTQTGTAATTGKAQVVIKYVPYEAPT